jgi:hypothetical protein
MIHRNYDRKYSIEKELLVLILRELGAKVN